MVFPLYDHSPFKWPTPPCVTWLLIAANVVVYLAEVASPPDQFDAAALVPATLFGDWSAAGLPAPLTLVTYLFLHANFWHIFGNMIVLWVFGDDVEEALGHWRFLLFYFVCGAGAGIAFALGDPGSTTKLVGASGAIAGVLAAYLLFRPCADVTVLFFIVPLRLRAFWIIGGWAIWQFFEVASRAVDGVAYMAHVGGLTAGVILFLSMRPPGVQLFECVEPQAGRRHLLWWPGRSR